MHPVDAFCYVCGQFIKIRAKKYSVKESVKMYVVYNAYFGMPAGDQDKPWAPHFTCEHCKRTLEGKVSTPPIMYPDIPSSIAPVPRCPELPVQTPPERDQPSSGERSKSDSEEDIADPDYNFTDAAEDKKPYSPTRRISTI